MNTQPTPHDEDWFTLPPIRSHGDPATGASKTPTSKAARHRAAQARYAASPKGKEKRKAWQAKDVRSGRKAARQRRYYANLSEPRYARMLFRNNLRRRRIADAADAALLGELLAALRHPPPTQT